MEEEEEEVSKESKSKSLSIGGSMLRCFTVKVWRGLVLASPKRENFACIRSGDFNMTSHSCTCVTFSTCV